MALLLLMLLAGTSYLYAIAEDETKILSDVTIYLEPPILGDGGTVIILPREIPIEVWRQTTGLENPALKDRRLDDRVPIKEFDRRLGAIVADPISIVQFDFPEGGAFQFRFSPFLGSDYPMEKLGTVLLSVGSAGDLHPKTAEEADVPRTQIMHILGSQMTEEQSRIRGDEIRVGFLKERYNCRDYELVLSCAASADLLNE
ncbi:hypothetical protein [Neorhizobium alkalisoli]|uniref:hypothetical protein n=1 Tax=Neorhizobium alkalisoli TaxID=528178 RepID=UPI000CFA02E2|nr:hypothetical protein [Neorhizobium alkalisoli]